MNKYFVAAKGKLKTQTKIGKTLHEFKQGALHSGSDAGPIVKDKKQALAIAINQSKRG
jgi:hypothetical protein